MSISWKGVLNLSWRCKLWLVDSRTYINTAADPRGEDAVISGPTSPTPPVVASVTTLGQAFNFLRVRGLGSEAAAHLEITKVI